MDCACCGEDIGHKPEDYRYTEDEEIVCTRCGATNVVFIDDDSLYFGAWRCSHGASGEEPCSQCEIEHGVAV